MPNPTGRPSKRTPEVIERIITGLSAGTPLTVICTPDDMPSPTTVRTWMVEDEALSFAIAGARDLGFDRIAADALTIADTPVDGVEITEEETAENGKLTKRKIADMLGHRKLQVETRLKLLAKWDPKRYGERTATEISGPDGGPLRTDARVALAPEAVQAVSDYASMLRAEMAAEKAAAES